MEWGPAQAPHKKKWLKGNQRTHSFQPATQCGGHENPLFGSDSWWRSCPSHNCRRNSPKQSHCSQPAGEPRMLCRRWVPRRKPRVSLMRNHCQPQPQSLARQLLPTAEFRTLEEYALAGARADCGPPWPHDAIDRALAAGPHVSACAPAGVELIWEDIQYQVDAGFVRIKSEEELFQDGVPRELKISRVAVVPQDNRRDRIILNLSAEVAAPHSRTICGACNL